MEAKKILLIHGPNLNKLGQRDLGQYGVVTLDDIVALVERVATEHNCEIQAMQSNHEGGLIDFIQDNSVSASGIIINPGALTHYSYALHDALLDTRLPVVEVHLSNISEREEWRRTSVTAAACIAQISGKKEKGYIEAVEVLSKQI